MTQPKTKIEIKNITDNQGQINIAEEINITQERPLTPPEEAKQAHLLEQELLKKRVQAYRDNLQGSIGKAKEIKEPYKGLYEYDITDANIFFGREKAKKETLKALENNRLTVLQSESGAGKTSLLQAGIIPQLNQTKKLPVYLRRPYNKIASECLKQVFLPDPNQAPILSALRPRAFLDELIEIVGKETTIFVLIDQFEEFFTVVSEDEQRKFIEELAECLDDPSLNVHWLISLRTEYFGQLGRFQPRIHDPFGNPILLNRLNRAESEEIVCKPAERFGLKFEARLLSQILDDLGKEKIAPPQLQLVCKALFDGLEANQKVFTHSAYQARGNAKGILNGYLENVLKRLPPPERTTARKILEILITSVQQRALRTQAEILVELTSQGVPSKEAEITLAKLIDSRLLRVTETETEQAYELAHDYLLNEIKLDEATKRRKQAAELLEQGVKNWKSHGLLLGRDTLELINNHRAELHPNDEEVELFILSAIQYQINPKPWEKFLDKKARQRIITRALQSKGKDKKSRQYANEILWYFSTELPTAQRGKFLLAEIPRRTLVKYLPQTLKLTFVALAVALFILVLAGLSFGVVQKWKYVTALETQCLGSYPDSRLVVTVDRKKDSNFAVYDPKNNRLCESTDSGTSWYSVKMPNGAPIENILGMDNNVFVVSKNSLQHKAFGQHDWLNLNIPNIQGSSLTGLAVNPKNSHEMMIATADKLFFTNDLGISWTEIKFDQIRGEITGITTDGAEIVVATTQGIWNSEYTPIEWIEIKDVPANQQIRSILIYDKFFYAVLDDKNIYTGDLNQYILLEGPQAKGEFPIPSWPDTKDDVESLAASRSVILVGNDAGLKCYPLWTFFRWEWWSEIFETIKPCQNDQTQ